MYDLMAMSPGDSAAMVTAVATVGILLGSLHSRILSYILGIKDSISEVKADIAEVKGRTLAIENRKTAIEESVRKLNERLDSYFQG